MDELRSEYLFDFAHICHIPPPMVGAGFRYMDFIQLILDIDAVKSQEN